jgi:hypothetical protein
VSRDDFRKARWYAIRPAANRKPATYRCPLCGGHLPALSEHMLVTPEGGQLAPQARAFGLRGGGEEARRAPAARGGGAEQPGNLRKATPP